MRIILASQSPRRRELLTAMGLSFDAIPSDFDEQLDASRSAEVVAVELALGKARLVASRYPEAIIIGSDTIVTDASGRQLGKAVDVEEEIAMLKSLCGKTSSVVSSVVVLCTTRGIELTAVERADVAFKPYDEVRQAFDTYIASGDWQDKAVYGIQSGAAPLIDHIAGRYDTILGLPTESLSRLLAKAGIAARPVQVKPPVTVL
jgi:nucleoside triphosphate pyrophosphatase